MSPEIWNRMTLAEVCEKPQYGWTTSAAKSGSIRLLRTTDITKPPFKWDSVPFCDEVPENYGKYLLGEDDIVISRAGSIGVSFRVTGVSEPAVFASYLIRIKPLKEIVEPRYLELFLKSPDYWNQLRPMSAGATLANINAKKLAAIEVPVPPLDEQRRIVAQLEDQLGRLEATRAQLATTKTQLEQLRASALNRFLSSNSSGDSDPSLPLVDLLALQIGGIWGDPVGEGEKDVRVVRITELLTDGTMDVTGGVIRSVSEKQFSSRRLVAGDLLLEKSGGGPNQPVGRVGLVHEQPSDVVCSNFMLLMRPDTERVLPKFLHLFLSHLHRSGRTIPLQTSTTNIRNIKTSDYLAQLIPTPSLDEQRRIVKEFNEIQLAIDAIESKSSESEALVESARASVLHSAFSGPEEEL